MTEMQISHRIARYSEQDAESHCWSLVIDGEIVSELWVDIKTGEIMQVETPRERQRQGYAGALYRAACAEMAVYHAPEAHRSYEGDRFARSVGGESLPCLHGCCDAGPDFDEE